MPTAEQILQMQMENHNQISQHNKFIKFVNQTKTIYRKNMRWLYKNNKMTQITWKVKRGQGKSSKLAKEKKKKNKPTSSQPTPPLMPLTYGPGVEKDWAGYELS